MGFAWLCLSCFGLAWLICLGKALLEGIIDPMLKWFRRNILERIAAQGDFSETIILEPSDGSPPLVVVPSETGRLVVYSVGRQQEPPSSTLAPGPDSAPGSPAWELVDGAPGKKEVYQIDLRRRKHISKRHLWRLHEPSLTCASVQSSSGRKKRCIITCITRYIPSTDTVQEKGKHLECLSCTSRVFMALDWDSYIYIYIDINIHINYAYVVKNLHAPLVAEGSMPLHTVAPGEISKRPARRGNAGGAETASSCSSSHWTI